MQAYLLSPVCPHAYVCVFIVCVCICSTNVLKLDWGSRFSHNIIGIVQSGERRDRKRRFVIAIGVIEWLVITYLQCDSSRGDDTQSPPFLQGLGEHDTKPVTVIKMSVILYMV